MDIFANITQQLKQIKNENNLNIIFGSSRKARWIWL